MRGGLCEPPHALELMTLPCAHAAHLRRPAALSTTLGRPALSPPSTAPRAAALTCRAAAAAEGAVRSKSERSTVRRRRRQGHAEAPAEPAAAAGQVEGSASNSLWALREPDEAPPPLEEEEHREDRMAEASPSGQHAVSASDDPQGQRAGAGTKSFAAEGGSVPLDGSNVTESRERAASSGASPSADAPRRASAERSRWDVRTMPADAGVEVVEPEVFEAGAPAAVSCRLGRPLVKSIQ